MSEEIAKLIDDSVAAVIDTEEVVAEVEKLEIMKGYYGNKLYDKLHPDENKPDLAFETVKKLAKKNQELRGMGVGAHLAKAGEKAAEATKEAAVDVKDKAVSVGKKAVESAKEAAEDVKGKVASAVKKADDMDIKGHLTSAGKKALAAVKDKAEELKDTVREHPGLAAATAAGLAAGVGGLAAVRRMRKASKK